jgi:hypothetical protein
MLTMIDPEWQLSVLGSLVLFGTVGVLARVLLDRAGRRRDARRGVGRW